MTEPHLHSAEPLLAPLWRRMAANLFDGLLLLIVCSLFLMLRLGMFLKAFSDPVTSPDSALFFESVKQQIALSAGFIISFTLAYFIALEFFWRRATFGKIVFGIRVYSSEYRDPDFQQTLKRLFGKFFFGGITLGLSWAAAILSPRRQAWHDRFANTLVGCEPNFREQQRQSD